MGTGDYERRIYPEDDIEVLGDYLMYRYYPDYHKKRHEMNLSYPLPAQYRVIFDQEFAKDNSVPEQSQQQSAASEDPKKEKKGNSVTLGLWMFPSDAREPLKDVMIRCVVLSACIISVLISTRVACTPMSNEVNITRTISGTVLVDRPHLTLT